MSEGELLDPFKDGKSMGQLQIHQNMTVHVN